MYAYISGKLAQALAGVAIVDVGGVGYRIQIPVDYFGKLPQKGETLLLHTTFVVREQSQTLYGFMSSEERDVFDILITISGIGPKTALAIIGHFSISKLKQVVGSKDISTLSKVPGIGKKTAERMLIDLGVKLLDVSSSAYPVGGKGEDAVSALTNLGYPRSRAESAVQRALDQLEDDVDLSLVITHALKAVS